MFGGNRRKAAATIVEAVQPMIRSIAMFGDLPKGFWEDPYVLGYLNGCGSMFAKLSTRGKINGMDLGLALTDAMNTLSGGQGSAISSRTLALHKANDPDMKLGMSNAIKCVSYTFGLSEFPGDADVAAAKRIGANMGDTFREPGDPTTERAQTAGALSVLLFQQVVRKRLGKD
jgi:hypothetical protein